MFSPADILLTDQVAIVTGGGQGIGEGIAMNFASFGANVAIADKNAEAAERVAHAIRGTGREALALACDVRDLDQVCAMTARVVAEFGRVDIIVNNAGGVRRAPFLELTERGWQKHIELNLAGLFGPTELAVRAMIDAGRGGSVINIASIEAFRAAPHRSVYGACKAGMINFTRSLALELADQGIRVNAVAPDTVATPGMGMMWEGEGGAARIEAMNRYIPMARAGTSDDIAGVCVFLASQLARYVTGETIHVDGGTFASSGWTKDEQGRWQTYDGMAGAF